MQPQHPYARVGYAHPGHIHALWQGQLMQSFECYEGMWLGDALGAQHFSLAISTFMWKILELCTPFVFCNMVNFNESNLPISRSY